MDITFTSALTLGIFLWQPVSAAWWGRCSYAMLKNAKFEAGDQIITVAFPRITNRFMAPHHSFFAVSNTQLFLAHMDVRSACQYMLPTIITAEGDEMWRETESQVVKPDPRIKIDPRKGIILAWRLNGLRVPYNLLNCNCRHYSDYLTYGRTFGSLSNFGYWPINERCPLYAPISGDVDVSAPDFVLKDRNGNAWELNPVPPEVLRNLDKQVGNFKHEEINIL